MDVRFLGRVRSGWPAIAAVAIALAISTGAWRAFHDKSWAQHWIHDQVAGLPDDELALWLAGLCEQGGPTAVAVIVQDLASDRRELRDAALSVLRSEVDRWATLPKTDATPRAVAMAKALQKLPAHVRVRSGAELTAKILAWAELPSCPASARGQILLALSGFRHTPGASATVSEQPAPMVEITQGSRVMSPSPTAGSGSEGANALSQAPDARSSGLGVRSTNANIGVGAASPRLLVPTSERRASDNNKEPDWDLSPLPDPAIPGAAERDAVLPEAPLPRQWIDARQFSQTPTRDLISQPNSEQREVVARELRSRGFSDEQLELAEHLSSADPKERLQWTEALPRIPHVDARPWLTWMTADRDADVRRTAVTLLGTSLDEPTRALLRTLATRDPDPSVRRLASELVQRNATAR